MYKRQEHEHGPAGAGGLAELPGPLLNALNLPHRPVQGRGHLLVHLGGLVPLHKAGGPAAALEEVLQMCIRDRVTSALVLGEPVTPLSLGGAALTVAGLDVYKRQPEGAVEHWEYVLMAYRADEE